MLLYFQVYEQHEFGSLLCRFWGSVPQGIHNCLRIHKSFLKVLSLSCGKKKSYFFMNSDFKVVFLGKSDIFSFASGAFYMRKWTFKGVWGWGFFTLTSHHLLVQFSSHPLVPVQQWHYFRCYCVLCYCLLVCWPIKPKCITSWNLTGLKTKINVSVLELRNWKKLSEKFIPLFQC